MKVFHTLLTCFLVLNVAWSNGFESPRYLVGESINGQEDWTSDGATITDEQSCEGGQSLKLEKGQTVSVAGKFTSVGFVDFEILPAFGNTSFSSVTIAGRMIGFIKRENTGSLVIFSDEFENAIEADVKGFPLEGDSNLSAEWIRITARVDPVRGRWDLFVNGRSTLSDLSIMSSDNIFEANVGEYDSAYIDSWQLSLNNPLLTDADFDRTPDVEDPALERTSFQSNRNGAANGVGIDRRHTSYKNISLQTEGMQLRGFESVLYVDNRHGNDANTGIHPESEVGSDGPKASIKGAVEAAPAKSLIVVLKGTGIYSEGFRGVRGKKLTIKAAEPLIIK